MAQSNVTIYGILDEGVEVVTHIGPTRASVVREPGITGTSPSRLGFRGTEDMGGGLKASFVLESGFSPDQGGSNQSGRLFGRQASVSLGGWWGTVGLGRQYSPLYYMMIGDNLPGNIYDAFVMDGYVANARFDNSISYRGTFGKFTFGALYSLGRDNVAPPAAGGCVGESATDPKACRAGAFGLQYTGDVVTIAGGIEQDRGGAGAGSPLPLSSQTDTRTFLNGTVKITPSVTLSGGVVHRKNEGIAAPITNMAFAGATWIIDVVQLDIQYSRLDHKSSANDAELAAARAMYLFSKRTQAYVTTGRIFNRGASTLTIDGGVVSGSTPLPGVGQTGLMVGVRHIF